MSQFELNQQLEHDTHYIASLETSELLLMDDDRWPWLILVPRLEDAVEWHDLFTDQRQDIDLEISQVAGVLKALSGCEKINIASIGNMVRQLHVHIIARSTSDPNWPGPVWGYGQRQPYTVEAKDELIEMLRAEII